MGINFWEQQRRARKKTALYVTVFITLTLVVASMVEVALRFAIPDSYDAPYPYAGLLFLGVTVGVALFQYTSYQTQGGGYVARSLGGWPAGMDENNFQENQLLNIVEEVALAANLPMPGVYVLPAKEINAFAAGLTREHATIAITQGALEQLNRDEIQGVLAHEFGHIYNGDMVLNLRLAAMLMGFFFVLSMGFRLLQMGSFTRYERRRDNERGGNPILIAAIILVIAGVVTWFFGSILRATVSRQREYLADASAVQFTRNTQGIANALRKIGASQIQDMPKQGMAYAHLYLENRSLLGSLFATHPPLSKRIAAIEGTREEGQ